MSKEDIDKITEYCKMIEERNTDVEMGKILIVDYFNIIGNPHNNIKDIEWVTAFLQKYIHKN